MANKGLLTIVLGGSALLAAGYSATSSAAKVAILPTRNVPIEVITVQPVQQEVILQTSLPTRPPARSLYRPGPRNPGTILE